MLTPTKVDFSSNRIQFYFQLLIIFIIIITSLACIIRQTGNVTLWTALLGCGLGYALPSPKLKEKSLLTEGLNLNGGL